ncbi:hypothetical protein RAH32_02960 [Paracoccus sp. WLY502]|uniref:hypothetical protein n=1 Tax=Paracoccus yibinensis TaxID=3068891 RepID=UPI0027967E92|nr:hypothetical protein [Paracoccus sp. WLY502]MDQ1899406.1 hypothetical protein [Paracoccus sp. WLY502]
MLRFLCLCLLVAVGQPSHAQPRQPVPPHQQAAHVLWDVMQLDRLAPVLRDEAVAEGAEMAATMFPRGGTGRWLGQVAAIHAPPRIQALFMRGAVESLTTMDPADLQAGLTFYGTRLGQRLLALETTARVAMLDKDVEAAARAAWAQAQRRSTPRAARIARLIDAADLVDPNVAGGLNASIAFARGFQAGGGSSMPLAEGEVIQNAWAEEPELRADTESWIGAYLFLAYSSLGDRELEAYIAFAESSAGGALSRVMFAGFDRVFTQTAHDMGLAAAAEMQGRQL